MGLNLKVGAGKSGVYMAIQRLLGARMVVLTATRDLQKQLMSEFKSMGLVDIRGQSNYICELDRDLAVSEGPCHDGLDCFLKTDKTCTYFAAYHRALNSKLVVTNYAFWLTSHAYAAGLGERDLLVCDEAHDAPEQLCNFLAVHLNDEEATWCESLAPEFGWSAWALESIAIVNRILGLPAHGRADMRRRARIRSLVTKLLRLAKADEAAWVFDRAGYRWDPIWAYRYGESLWQGAAKVILTSATIAPKTLHLMGISNEDHDFFDYPSSFDEARRPVFWIPTAKITRYSTPEDLTAWVARIDEIIDGRLDRKGIIHTVSYKRARFLAEASRHADKMLVHGKGTDAVTRFRRSRPPTILVSPVVSTGHDFPYDLCRYQIVGKIAFPDSRTPLMAKRSELDKSYPMYLAVVELEQMVGRGMRMPDDFCETFVVDDSVGWLLRHYAKFASRSFKDSFKRRKYVPAPPPLDY